MNFRIIKKYKFIILAGIIVLGLGSYRKRYLLLNTLNNIKWMFFKTLSEYSQKPNFEIISKDIFPHLTFIEPISFKFIKVNNQESLFLLERGGKLKKIDSINKTAMTVFNLENIVNKNETLGALDFELLDTKNNASLLLIIYSKKEGKKNHLIVSSFPFSNINKNIQNTETIIIDIEAKDHQGGTLKFGRDGFLYISIGDGEDKDPNNQAQDLSKLYGKILRVDVHNKGISGYSIPHDNPFFGNKMGFREEIYAYGFRNPFRFSIDDLNNMLWVGDVGQDKFEEINLVKKGGNYGWRIMEGDSCFNNTNGCQNRNLQKPMFSYKHGIEGYSVTGGQIYKGDKIPYLKGKYIYGDYVRGVLWALEFKDQKFIKNELIAQNVGNVTAFGCDFSNELYFCDMIGGKIKKIMPKK